MALKIIWATRYHALTMNTSTKPVRGEYYQSYAQWKFYLA